MQIAKSSPLAISSDRELIAKYLPMQNSTLLELGCGAAYATRLISEAYPSLQIIATEVDQIQHEKNLQIDDLPRVTFKYGGAEAIDQADNSIDAAIMLKSLHHVPMDLMAQSFVEIQRVLKPGGLLYISEPVYAGVFNEILLLFNDEKIVREAAFSAMKDAVESDLFELAAEIHFLSVSKFQGFEAFEKRILGATHSNFDIDQATFEEVKKRFLPHIGADGVATFENPARVNILRKPK